MDLMYGCGSEYDISLQELIECDLKTEMDRIMNAGGNADLMTELANSPLITDEGFDEFDIRFDGHDRMLDPFGLTLGVINGHDGGVTRSHSKHAARAAALASAVSWNAANSSLIHNGFSFDEQYGIMVDPSSIVPVSVSGSGSSASSGSETDPECVATDEEEDAELITGTIQGWIVPQSDMGSRSPSPIGVVAEPEFELEEPEFIEPVPEEPPTKKRKQKHEPQPHTDGKIYPKPAFSYSCLIAMALKNSKPGCLPVSEIYKFMCDHFPYFKSAPSGWKNSVRHNLSLNKCFEKIEKPGTGARKGCLWALNPLKVTKMDEEVQKWSRKDPIAIRRAMSDPENLELIEKGELKRDYSGNAGSDEDDEEDFSEPATPVTPAQLQARRNRATSSDSILSIVDSRVSSTTPSNISQIRSTLLQRPVDHKLHLKDNDHTLDFGTITNVQGNYLCHASNGTNTYTLSFSSLHNSPTPLIIRRTPVK